MKKTLAILLTVILLLLVGCRSSDTTPAKMEAVESPIEELRFGMTVSEAKAALPEGCELEEYSTAFTTTLGLRSYPGKVYGYELKVGDLIFDQPYSYRGVKSEPILTEMKLQLVGDDYEAAVKKMTGLFGAATETLKIYDPMELGKLKQVPANLWTPTGKGIEAYDISVQAMAAALSGRYFPITMKEGITEFRTDNITSLDQVEEFGVLHFDGTQMERFQNREDYVYFQVGSFIVADCTDRDVIRISCFSGLSAYAELAQRCLKIESLLTPPTKGLEWGMTLEEVQTVLDEAGVTPVESNSAHGVWLAITHEDAGKVGMETVAELALSESSLQPITLHFMVDLDGTARLSSVTVEIVVPSEEDRLPLTTAKEELTAWLTKTYGEPVPGTTARWGITGTKITEEQAQNLTMAERGLLESDGYDCLNIYPQLNYAMGGSLTNLEATLMYFAGSYVHLLYGNYQ